MPTRFLFDPDQDLSWCLINVPVSQDHAVPNDHLSVEEDVSLSAGAADNFFHDGLIVVWNAAVTNRVQPATVMRMELVVPVRDGTRVLCPGRPSGRFSAEQPWLWPAQFRLGASDGVSGALEFPAWDYDLEPDDIVPGNAVLAATFATGKRVEAKVDLRLMGA